MKLRGRHAFRLFCTDFARIFSKFHVEDKKERWKQKEKRKKFEWHWTGGGGRMAERIGEKIFFFYVSSVDDSPARVYRTPIISVTPPHLDPHHPRPVSSLIATWVRNRRQHTQPWRGDSAPPFARRRFFNAKNSIYVAGRAEISFPPAVARFSGNFVENLWRWERGENVSSSTLDAGLQGCGDILGRIFCVVEYLRRGWCVIWKIQANR